MLKTKFGNATLHHNGHYRITSGKEGNHGKFLHRLIYEDYHKCTILPHVDCHHKNGDKTDNSIENLELMYHSKHSSYHNTGDNNPKARLGVIVSEETKRKISQAKTGKLIKPEPHIVLGGFTSNGNRMYRLIANSKEIAFSIDKNKLQQMIDDGSYKKYQKRKKYEIDIALLKEKYDEGKTMQELSEIFGCSRKTISRRLHKIYSDEQINERKCINISKGLSKR